MQRGTIVSIRGSIVEVAFSAELPSLHSLLETQGDCSVLIEVVKFLSAHRVQGLALQPTQGLSRGTAVEALGHTLQVPVGDRVLGHMFNAFVINAFVKPLNQRTAVTEIFPTKL